MINIRISLLPLLGAALAIVSVMTVPDDYGKAFFGFLAMLQIHLGITRLPDDYDDDDDDDDSRYDPERHSSLHSGV